MTYELIDDETLNTSAAYDDLLTAFDAWSKMDPGDASTLILAAFNDDGNCTGARSYGQAG